MSLENKKSEVIQVKKKIIRLTASENDEKVQEPNRDIEVSLDDYIHCRQRKQNNSELNNNQSKSSERVGIKFKECLTTNFRGRNKINWRDRNPRCNNQNDSFLFTSFKKTISNPQSYSRQHQRPNISILAAEDYYYYNNNSNNKNSQNPSVNYPVQKEDYPPTSYLETYEENFETEDKEPYTEEIYEFDIDPEDGILKPISAIRYSTSPLLDPYQGQHQYQHQHPEPTESSPIKSDRKFSGSSKKSDEKLNLDVKKCQSPVKAKAKAKPKTGGYWMNGYEEIVPDDKIPHFILMHAQIKEEKEDEESKSQSQNLSHLDNNDVKTSSLKSIIKIISSPSSDKIISKSEI